MNKTVKEQLDTISPLQDETWNELMKVSVLKTTLKNKGIVKEDELFNYEVFLIQGALRCYYVTDDAKEYTTSFYKEGEFIAPAFSRQSKGKSLLNIQALENCKMLFFEEDKFTALRYKYRDLLILGSKISEKELMLKSKKEVLLATGNLKSLYLFFQNNFPGLENRIAQRYVASYIGADPVSLSRVRSELLKESSIKSTTKAKNP